MVTDQKLTRCGKCGQVNRINSEKLDRGLQPKCGQCGEPLVVSNGPVNVSESTFDQVVSKSAIPVLVDFWAPWCGPCHSLAPTIEKIAGEFSERIRVAKVNTDENPNLAARFRIQGIPTLIVFVNGREVDRIVGVLPKQAIVSRISAHL